MPLDFSQAALRTMTRNLERCKTLSDAERYLQDLLPENTLSRPQAWGIWDGFKNRPKIEVHSDWTREQAREYASCFSLGQSMR